MPTPSVTMSSVSTGIEPVLVNKSSGNVDESILSFIVVKSCIVDCKVVPSETLSVLVSISTVVLSSDPVVNSTSVVPIVVVPSVTAAQSYLGQHCPSGIGKAVQESDEGGGQSLVAHTTSPSAH